MSVRQVIVDHGFDAIITEMKNAKHRYVKVGFPLEKEAAPGELAGMPEVTLVAMVQEFGSEKRNIPERPFIRGAFDANYTDLQAFKEAEFLQVMQGKQTADTGIRRIGEWMVNKTKAYIKAIIPPPNAPTTIARKHSTTPLIDTGQMINSIQYAVTSSKE